MCRLSAGGGAMTRVLMMAMVAFLLAGCSKDFWVAPPPVPGPILQPTQAQLNHAHGYYVVSPPPY
jgi:outer membrane biogenesis lipoprotein LolB